MTITHLAAGSLALALLSACTQHGPYRTRMPTVGQDDSRRYFQCAVDERHPKQGKAGKGCFCEDPGSGDRAIQLRHYWGRFEDDQRDTGDYYLSFVEFDEQGGVARQDQVDELFTLLARLEKDEREVLIHVYAHGWKHNASHADDNVVYFSRLLERMDLVERKILGTERVVVGVYLGWRGLPYKAGALTNLSFWNRKAVATRVGQGRVFELLDRLNHYRSRRRTIAGDRHALDKTQLMITGHSFGGLLIYSALQRELLKNAGPRPGSDGIVESFGDFVLLVNPAFEGSVYEPLHQAAASRTFSADQRPVMMIVTSEADVATRVAFPVGRKLGTLFEFSRSPEEAKGKTVAIGHNERYQTHILEGERIKAPDSGSSGPRDRAYPHLQATAEWSQQGLQALIDGIMGGTGGLGETAGYGKGVRLAPVSNALQAPRNPFLVVRTDKQIIANHSAIYGERFMNFVQMFYLQHVLSRAQ